MPDVKAIKRKEIVGEIAVAMIGYMTYFKAQNELWIMKSNLEKNHRYGPGSKSI
jgi:hypothetical protein